MARNMITGIETQKMQEYTQEQIDRAEHMGIAIPADVKEQIFEYANLVGEEEKVRTLVRNLADAVNRSDEDRVEELLDDAQMDIQDLPDPTIGKLELRDYGYTAEDMVPLRKAAALDYHRMGSKIYCLGSDGSKGEYASKEMIQAHEGLFGMESQMWERIRDQDLDYVWQPHLMQPLFRLLLPLFHLLQPEFLLHTVPLPLFQMRYSLRPCEYNPLMSSPS